MTDCYPDPHYDEDDTCQCPDHTAMREAREQQDADELPLAGKLFRSVFDRGTIRRTEGQ